MSDTRSDIIDLSSPIDNYNLDPSKRLYNSEMYVGVPIGDWTSQIAGLLITTPALNLLTQMGYKFIHYTDDTVLIIKDLYKWKSDIKYIIEFYKKKLHLTIHPKKQYLQHYGHGVSVIGYKLRYNRILFNNRSYNNMILSFQEYIKLSYEDFGVVLGCREKIQSIFNSYLGRLKYCNGYNIKRKLCGQIQESPLNKIFDVDSEYTKVVIKEKYKSKTLYRKKYNKLKNEYRRKITI